MKKQAFNPYLPSYEYVPDGEPHIWDGRVYIYGSHDKFNGFTFCMNDYVCWSAPVEDLSSWRYEGVIYRRSDDPCGKRSHNIIQHALAAPDMCRGADGRYYLYYFINDGYIKAAVCDTPAGKYHYYGIVKYADGTPLGKKDEPKMFDPGIFVDDDGRIYLYSGFGLKSNPILLRGEKPTKHGAMVFELEPDMLTLKENSNHVRYIGIKGIDEGAGTAYEGHEFLEASSMRKFGDTYYFIYSSYQSHELCYAVSDNPVSGFQYGGVLISNGDIGLNGRTKENAVNYTGNVHGSLIRINGYYYIFYHRQTNRHQFSRQACAEQIQFYNGKFYQAEVTSCGLNDGPLEGKGEYEARIACQLFTERGTRFYGAFRGIRPGEPYFTQTGRDREDNPDQYIANIRNGTTAGFKYFSLNCPDTVSIFVRGKADGKMLVMTGNSMKPVAQITVRPSANIAEYTAEMKPVNGMEALFFRYEGTGSLDFYKFVLS